MRRVTTKLPITPQATLAISPLSRAWIDTSTGTLRRSWAHRAQNTLDRLPNMGAAAIRASAIRAGHRPGPDPDRAPGGEPRGGTRC